MADRRMTRSQAKAPSQLSDYNEMIDMLEGRVKALNENIQSEEKQARTSASWTVGDQGNDIEVTQDWSSLESKINTIVLNTLEKITGHSNKSGGREEHSATNFKESGTPKHQDDTNQNGCIRRHETHRERYSQHRDRRHRSVSTEDECDDSPDKADARQYTGNSHVKIPTFSGDEKWNVWYQRFEAISTRRNWTQDDKLDELLQLLRGEAAEFVYEQLNRSSRRSYIALCHELQNRFRIVKTTKTFGVKFSRRCQKPGETVEAFAADLKRLYDNAHPQRDKITRHEDLLRRFLDGLLNSKASFHVEYIKEPENIDDAVYEVVNFEETKRTFNRENLRGDTLVRHTYKQKSKEYYESESTDSDMEQVARVPLGSNKRKIIKFERNVNDMNMDRTERIEENNKPEIQNLKDEMSLLKKGQDECLQTLNSLINKMNNPRYQQQTPYYQNGVQTQQRKACFYCKAPDHFIRDCPLRIQMNTNAKDGNRNYSPSQTMKQMTLPQHLN